jgi:hypothetical protein
MYVGFLKCPLFFSDFNDTLIFVTTQNFMKTRTLGAEMFHADGQTDRQDGASSRFSQFFERA